MMLGNRSTTCGVDVFSNKVIEIIKKCAPKLVFLNERKKLRKIRLIFDIKIEFQSQILAHFDS